MYRPYMTSEEIYHFGIKRRSGRYPWGSGERPYQSIEKKDIDIAVNRYKRSPKFKEAKIIPKGTTVYRTESGDRNRPGSVFVSYTQQDRNMYRSLYQEQLRSQTGIKDYQIKTDEDILPEDTYVLTEDLKIPSRKTLREAYANSLTAKEVGLAYANAYVHKPQNKQWFDDMFINDPERAKEEYEVYVKRAPQMILEKALNGSLKNSPIYDSDAFYYYVWYSNENPTLRNKVIANLKEQGYNAMTDEGGVGGKSVGDISVQGVDPIIVFDRQQSMEYKETNKLKFDEYMKLGRSIYGWREKATSVNRSRNREW